jgi:hypothetical protein
MTHNVRHLRGPESQRFFTSVPKILGSRHENQAVCWSN